MHRLCRKLWHSIMAYTVSCKNSLSWGIHALLDGSDAAWLLIICYLSDTDIIHVHMLLQSSLQSNNYLLGLTNWSIVSCGTYYQKTAPCISLKCHQMAVMGCHMVVGCPIVTVSLFISLLARCICSKITLDCVACTVGLLNKYIPCSYEENVRSHGLFSVKIIFFCFSVPVF